MKMILKSRWLIMAIWIGGLVALLMTAPSMANLVREKGGIALPEGYPSVLAAEMQERHQTKDPDELSIIAVFHNAAGLTASDKDAISATLGQLKSSAQSLGITSMMSAFDSKELESQMAAKDNKTMIAMVNVKQNGRDTAEIREALQKPMEKLPVEHYLTGQHLIDEDVVISSEKGLQRTELITVFFILIVLVLVFRSVVAPLIPLVTVGITYLASQSIVAFLVDQLNFPISNFTQIFLVAVLFGIGTDYCILLLSRFKEELAHNPGQVQEAIIKTYSTAGRTVIFSGLAALVGFSTIGLASFKLYQSATAVAIGVAVLLTALFTIVPFFMALLGGRLFWPSKRSSEHQESRMWAATGSFSLRKPWAALLLAAVIVVPLLLSYKGTLSFNSLNEIGENYDSVKGFNLVADSFGPGEAMTTKVVLESDKTLDNEEAFGVIEKVSRELLRAPGVAKVRSLTRPLGEEMPEFAVASQAKTVSDGLGQGSAGLETIKNGLAEASKSLSGSTPQMAQATDGINQLVDGTGKLKNGVEELQAGLTRIEQGVRSGATGAGDLANGISALEKSAQQLADSGNQLLSGYEAAKNGLGQLTGMYNAVQAGLKDSAAALASLEARFAALDGKFPGLAEDSDYIAVRQTVAQTAKGIGELEAGLGQLTAQLNNVQTGLVSANAGLSQLVTGQSGVAGGIKQVGQGATSLQAGLTAAANGQNQAVANLPAIQAGLTQLAQGQGELANGFSSVGGQLQQLVSGLDQSAGGIGQVQTGLAAAQAYLNELAAAQDKETSGWFFPKEAAQNPQFQQVLATYLSPDKKLASFELVLATNPYEAEAMASVDGIREAAEKAIQGTALEGSQIGISGVTSVYHDLDNMSSSDYKRTVLLMLIGITLVLIILLRSLVMPIYLIGSLAVCYFSSLAVNELIFVRILGHTGTSWAIPFFGFVMLMALGVDYSIFLMDRFNEHKDDETAEAAILIAMKKMGTVIVSAVIILAGTFAAMYPSGVMSLLQIATVVLAGLFLYALLFLQFVVPVMVKLFGRGNWWPFMPKRK
jgi:putative drug exporter of the RND superfamily